MARMACLPFNFKPKTAIYRPIGKFILAKFFPESDFIRIGIANELNVICWQGRR
jgi:hypothetical protein